jgi:carbonic anhydrase
MACAARPRTADLPAAANPASLLPVNPVPRARWRSGLLVSLAVLACGLSAAPPQPGPSPDEALARLKEGNARYRSDTQASPRRDGGRRSETALGQKPFAVVLSCSDSRVPPEIVFDQGLGDLFVVRVAGNVAGGDEIASIEYGTGHLGAPLIVVMGHSACGAVTAGVEGAQASGNLAGLLHPIIPAAERARKANPGASGAPLIAAAIEANVWVSIENLLGGSDELRALVSSGKVRVVGALYDLASGQVRILGPHPEQARLLAAPGHVGG